MVFTFVSDRLCAPLGRVAAVAMLRRSWRLLRSFSFEQSDPGRFYGPLAEDTAELIVAIAADMEVSGEPVAVLDVGGGPGYFHRAFASRGMDYVTVEPDVGEMAAAGISVPASVRGSGMDLPFRDECFDVVYSSNVAEHVAKPWQMADEMLRVSKPGGVMVLSYTVWLGPFGGHETGLWPHYVGGDFARRRYERVHGRRPKNVFGESLFAVSCAQGLRWGRRQGAVFFPRYHPWWAWWVVRVPILREFLTSNLVIVVKKKDG